MRKFWISAGLLCGAALAGATTTGLSLIPIADILKHREGFFFVGLSGNERNVSKGYSYFHAATVGLFDRVEIGYDNDFMGSTTYNVKLQLFDGLPKAPGAAMSIGVTNCTGGFREPYIVGRQDFKAFRLHAGYWNTMGCGRFMVGTDFKAFGKGTGSLEFLSGPSSQSWASLYYPIDQVPGLGVFFSVGVPSNHHEGVQHLGLLMYSFKL